MKRLISMTLALLLCFPMPVIAVAVEENNDSFVSGTLTENNNILYSDSNDHARLDRSDSVISNFVTIAISSDMKFVHIEGIHQGVQYSIDLPGSATEVVVDELVGFVGVYDGFVVFDNVNDSAIYVVADVIFTDSEIFAAIGFGVASDTSTPDVSFYGTLTNSLSTISTAYSKRISEIGNDELFESNWAPNKAVRSVSDLTEDSKYQGQVEITGGEEDDYVFGYISVFHSNEIKDTGVSSFHIKVNTNTANVLNYVREELGYKYINNNAYSAQPDRFIISATLNHTTLFFLPDSHTPKNGQKTFTLPIPIIKFGNNFSITEVSSVEMEFVTSETAVVCSPYFNNTIDIHKIEWTMNSTFGFNSNYYDGNVSSGTGMLVAATVSYDGGTSTFYTSVTSRAAIRYRYYIDTAGTILTLHFTTDTKPFTTQIKLSP